MYLSICKEHSHKLAHYLSHKETLYENHFYLLSKALFLSCFLLFFSCGVLWILAHAPIYKRIKPKLPYMHEDTCHLPFMQNTKCPLQWMHHTMCRLQCMHHNMCYSYTTPTVHHTPCYLSSHATFHFVKYTLTTWQWLDPIKIWLSLRIKQWWIHISWCYKSTQFHAVLNLNHWF